MQKLERGTNEKALSRWKGESLRDIVVPHLLPSIVLFPPHMVDGEDGALNRVGR